MTALPQARNLLIGYNLCGGGMTALPHHRNLAIGHAFRGGGKVALPDLPHSLLHRRSRARSGDTGCRRSCLWHPSGTVVDFFYLNGRGNEYALATIKAAEDLGIRLVLARTFMDWDKAPATIRETVPEACRRYAELATAPGGAGNFLHGGDHFSGGGLTECPPGNFDSPVQRLPRPTSSATASPPLWCRNGKMHSTSGGCASISSTRRSWRPMLPRRRCPPSSRK
jgi:hypothetical protein